MAGAVVADRADHNQPAAVARHSSLAAADRSDRAPPCAEATPGITRAKAAASDSFSFIEVIAKFFLTRRLTNQAARVPRRGVAGLSSSSSCARGLAAAA